MGNVKNRDFIKALSIIKTIKYYILNKLLDKGSRFLNGRYLCQAPCWRLYLGIRCDGKDLIVALVAEF